MPKFEEGKHYKLKYVYGESLKSPYRPILTYAYCYKHDELAVANSDVIYHDDKGSARIGIDQCDPGHKIFILSAIEYTPEYGVCEKCKCDLSKTGVSVAVFADPTKRICPRCDSI